jgi:hypothetical protein
MTLTMRFLKWCEKCAIRFWAYALIPVCDVRVNWYKGIDVLRG